MAQAVRAPTVSVAFIEASAATDNSSAINWPAAGPMLTASISAATASALAMPFSPSVAQ